MSGLRWSLIKQQVAVQLRVLTLDFFRWACS